MFIVDAHLDLAYNALNFGRNLFQPVAAIRAAEEDSPNPNGIATVSIPALLAGGVGLVFASLFVMPASRRRNAYPSRIIFDDALPRARRQTAAHALAVNQLNYYWQLDGSAAPVHLVQTWEDLQPILAAHDTAQPELGLLLVMEGADPIRDPGEVEWWYARGLRGVGLAWDDSRYAPGQWRREGRLLHDGYRLLERMAQLNMVIDLTHMSEAATYDVLDAYDGPVVATHCNARALTPTPRHLSDQQLRLIAEHGGVVGVVLYNVFLRADHEQGDPRQAVTLEHVAAHIDHICQVTGSAAHVGLGSDWDGGFGLNDIPDGMDDISDLSQIAGALAARGYSTDEIAAVMGVNWLNLLRRVLQ